MLNSNNKEERKMKKTYFMSIACIVICSLLALPAAGAQTVELRSPDGSLSVPLRWNEEGMLVYKFSADGKLLIDESILGMKASGKSFDMGLVDVNTAVHRRTEDALDGKQDNKRRDR